MKEVKSIPTLPPRSPESHKGTYGHVAVMGGSLGLTGAPVMAADAAMRMGAGLVTCACPAHLNTILEIKLTEAMTWPLPVDEQGCLNNDALSFFQSVMDRFDALVVGPGIGRHETTQTFVGNVLNAFEGPIVVDADGLLAFADDQPCTPSMVLTPHPGEFARMIGSTPKAVQADRLKLALDYAQKRAGILVLKGHETIVAGQGAYFINATGNPGMATGGAGDVLSGIIGALLARGLAPFDAACLGCWLHGRAGDLGAELMGEESLVATDLLAYLPQAIQERKAESNDASQ